jgi:hypothetical protein
VLVELSVVEQRYAAVLEVTRDGLSVAARRRLPRPVDSVRQTRPVITDRRAGEPAPPRRSRSQTAGSGGAPAIVFGVDPQKVVSRA